MLLPAQFGPVIILGPMASRLLAKGGRMKFGSTKVRQAELIYSDRLGRRRVGRRGVKQLNRHDYE